MENTSQVKRPMPTGILKLKGESGFDLVSKMRNLAIGDAGCERPEHILMQGGVQDLQAPKRNPGLVCCGVDPETAICASVVVSKKVGK